MTSAVLSLEIRWDLWFLLVSIINKTLLNFVLLSILNYCHMHYTRLSNHSLYEMLLLVRSSTFCHVTPLFMQLLWLSVHYDYILRYYSWFGELYLDKNQTASLNYYILENPSRALLSCDQDLLVVPYTNLKTKEDSTFSSVTPKMLELHSSDCEISRLDRIVLKRLLFYFTLYVLWKNSDSKSPWSISNSAITWCVWEMK